MGGTALAFAALTGTVQAIPVSLQSNPPRLMNTDSPFSVNLGMGTYSFGSSGFFNTSTRTTVYLSSHPNFWPWQHTALNLGVKPHAPAPLAGPQLLTSVPDGGTTALMLGGGFCVCVGLRKKLAA